MSPDPIWGQLLLQVVLILLNAFFAATEIALLSVNSNRIKKLAEEGDRKANQLLKILDEPTGFLSTIQIGITLAGFLGSAFAAENFAGRITDWVANKVTVVPPDVINTISVILITLILSYFTLVLGELVPKRIAMQKPEKVARFSCSVIWVMEKLVHPLIWLLTVSTNGMLRLLHINPNKEEEKVSEDEIMLMVDLGEEKGTIESNEKELIENVFEFTDLTAEDVMVHRTDIEFLWLDNTDQEILNTIQRTGLSRFPVCGEDKDDVKGLLMARDFLLNEHQPEPKTILQLLRPAYFVPESIKADSLFHNMQTQKSHMAIVVDEYGGTSGLVTMEDLLEKLVGNIYDELDPQEENGILPLEDNLWKIEVSTKLEDIAEALDVSLPEDEEFDTLNGLVMDTLGIIPEDGNRPQMDLFGLHIQVLEVKDRRVEWALVSKLATAVLEPEQIEKENN